MASRFSVSIGRKPIPKNSLYARGSPNFSSASTETFMSVYRIVMSPKFRIGLFLFRLFIKYALDSSVPNRVVLTTNRFRAIPLGVNDAGLFPNLFIKPTSIRMNMWKAAVSRAIWLIRLSAHDRISSRPTVCRVARAMDAQQIEGTKKAINPPGRYTFRITATANSEISIVTELRDMLSHSCTICAVYFYSGFL